MTGEAVPGPKNLPDLNAWIGRSEEQHDVIDAIRARRMQAALDDPFPELRTGDPLPPLWHWAYFWEESRNADLGPDGLAVGQGLMPPIDLPRIMWAGSRVTFPAPLIIGHETQRRSTILRISEKQGRTGRLCFVTLRHDLFQQDRLCVEEEMDVVYREAAGVSEERKTPEGRPAPPDSSWRRDVRPDPVLLFRYSALTWNSHRIHYDKAYTMDHEGYPGLIVHGPLLATVMIGQLRCHQADARVKDFSFSALRPVFDRGAFTVGGTATLGGTANDGTADLWVADSEGFLAMDGTASFEL